jgi:hypothetical protein
MAPTSTVSHEARFERMQTDIPVCGTVGYPWASFLVISVCMRSLKEEMRVLY